MARTRRTRSLQGLSAVVVQRRDMLTGGLGLLSGAFLGGLQDDRDFTEPETEPEPEPPPEEPQAEPEQTVWRRGDSGDAVRTLQEQLSATGYWCGTPDDGYGHLTEQAVFAVQKANGLTRDGVAGPDVLSALSAAQRPAPVGTGDLVEVHLGSQLILIVRGGATTTVLNTSTANGEPYEFQGREYTARTKTGDFAVWLMDDTGWRDGELGEMYKPMFYDGNYAIHGSSSIPPFPASHGCARVSVAAMEMIWAEGVLGMGDRVLVV